MSIKKSIIAASLAIGFCGNALAATVSFVVPNNSETISVAKSALVKNAKVLSERYVRITVDAEDEYTLLNSLSAAGVHAESDGILVRPPQVSTGEVSGSGTISSKGVTVNDPLVSSQTYLNFDGTSILDGMAYQRDANEQVKVLILDTGSMPHEDVVFHGGFNYATYFGDPDREATDYEDYTRIVDEESGLVVSECESGHGISMAGIIGAKQNNARGIAGISNAELYMGRVVETDCSTGEDVGYLSDVYDALSDVSRSNSSSGIPTPDVVSMSLAAKSTCPGYLQEVIDELYDAGTTLVVSAGNAGGLAASYAPANCNNVVVVGAASESGFREAYSNSGDQVDVSMTGDFFTTLKGNMYGDVTGTSGAAAAVSGIVAVIKQNYPDASAEQIETVLKLSSTALNPDGCDEGCGEGFVNLRNGLEAAEALIDPDVNFYHSMDDAADCKVTREVEALQSSMNICDTMIGRIDVSYAEEQVPAAYDFELRQRNSGGSTWTGSSMKVLFQYSPTENNDAIPLLDVSGSELDYGIARCYESPQKGRVCPYVETFDISTIQYPTSCM
tara:strand:+ start:23644 stop:25323 length:1680 start_codon:yes stop_codon:yes gene_type:complete